MDQEKAMVIPQQEKPSSGENKPKNKPLELELDLRDSDLEIFQRLRKGVTESRLISLHILNGTSTCVPDQVLNWFWILNCRPKKCRIISHFHCNLKLGALILAAVSDQVIPRIGSWYSIPSVEATEKEILEHEFAELHEHEKISFGNLKQTLAILSQFLDVKECTDKRIPMERLKDYGFPLKYMNRARWIKQIEI